MKKEDLKGYFEIKSFVIENDKEFPQKQLLESMENSQIHYFGWPIGVVLHTDNHRPKPTPEGVIATIIHAEDQGYDFWKLTKKAEMYILLSLFEDRRTTGVIYFDTRIIRTTEALMRVGLFYKQLGFNEDSQIAIELEYGGLNNRILTVANPNRLMAIKRACTTDKYKNQIIASLHDLLNVEDIKKHVSNYLFPFFELFDFFTPNQNIVDEIIEAFYNGKTY